MICSAFAAFSVLSPYMLVILCSLDFLCPCNFMSASSSLSCLLGVHERFYKMNLAVSPSYMVKQYKIQFVSRYILQSLFLMNLLIKDRTCFLLHHLPMEAKKYSSYCLKLVAEVAILSL